MSQKELPLAEKVERQYRMMAFVIFLLALIYALMALRKITEVASVDSIAQYAQIGLVATMLSSIAVLIYWKIGLIRSVPHRRYLAEPEGYAWDVWRKAMVHSWVATLFILTLAGKFEEWFGGNVDLLASFGLAVMLGVFSSSFFIQYRTDVDEETAEGEAT